MINKEVPTVVFNNEMGTEIDPYYFEGTGRYTKQLFKAALRRLKKENPKPKSNPKLGLQEERSITLDYFGEGAGQGEMIIRQRALDIGGKTETFIEIIDRDFNYANTHQQRNFHYVLPVTALRSPNRHLGALFYSHREHLMKHSVMGMCVTINEAPVKKRINIILASCCDKTLSPEGRIPR